MEHLLYRRANHFVFKSDRSKEYMKFVLDGHHIGFMRNDYWPILSEHGDGVFVRCDRTNTVSLNKNLMSDDARGSAVQAVMEHLREKDLVPCLRGWRNEKYKVCVPQTLRPLFRLERAACSILGVSKFGCHINGYVERDGSTFMWIGIRSATKPTFPGMLDNVAAGGLNCEMTPFECAVNECEEEAGISREYSMENLKPCGTVSCCFEDDRGVNPETEYVFDLRLPTDFVPRNEDGEVDGFQLIPIEDMVSMVINPKFKVNSALCVIDFLIRHGIINSGTSGLDIPYSVLVNMIHLRHPFDDQ